MSITCDLCGKRVRFGHNISHSQRHTKRRWLPNIRRATLVIKGQQKQVNICMRCLRTQHKISQ